MPHTGATIKRMEDKQQDGNALGDLNEYQEQHIVRSHSGGDIEGYVYVDNLGMFLTAMFGSTPTTTGSSPNFSHAFAKANTTTGSSLSIFRKDGDNYQEAFSGARLSAFQMDFMTDSWATYKATLVGQNAVANTTTAPSAPATTSRFRPNDISVKLATNQAGIGSATAIKCKSCVFKYASAVEGYPVLGSTGFGDIISSSYNVMVDLTLLFDAETYRNLWISDTPQYLQIEANSTATAGNPKLTLNIPRCKVDAWDETHDIGKYVEETFTLTSMAYNATTSFNATLVNNVVNTRYGV